MNKKIIILLCALAFVFGAQAVLADSKNGQEKEKGNATSTENRDKEKGNATSTKERGNIKTLDVACIQSALDKRESAVIAAFDKKTSAVKTALDQRKTDLKAAWALSGLKDRIKARLVAWKNFKKADVNSRMTYRKEVKSAWAQYKTDKKACNVKESDEESQGTDNSL